MAKERRPSVRNSAGSYIRNVFSRSGRAGLSNANVRVHNPDNSVVYRGKAGGFLRSKAAQSTIYSNKSYYNRRNNTFVLKLRKKI